MSLLKRLFGGERDAAEVTSETYKDFRIFPEPQKDAGGWRIAARIEKDRDGEVLVHRLIRADTIQDHDVAIEASSAKARQLIDEQGDRIFD